MAEADANTSAMPVLQAGEKLRRAREREGIDLASLAAWTRIKEQHLHALERGDYAYLPGRTYAIGFARTYAQAVGLQPDEIARELREELNQQERATPSRPAHHFELDDPAKVPSRRLAWVAGLLALLVLGAIAVFWRSYFSPAAELPPVVAQEAAIPAAPELSPRAQISPTAESAVLARPGTGAAAAPGSPKAAPPSAGAGPGIVSSSPAGPAPSPAAPPGVSPARP